MIKALSEPKPETPRPETPKPETPKPKQKQKQKLEIKGNKRKLKNLEKILMN